MYLVSLYYLSCICKKLKEDLPKIFQAFYIYYSENIQCCHAVSSKINTNRNTILKRRHILDYTARKESMDYGLGVAPICLL